MGAAIDLQERVSRDILVLGTFSIPCHVHSFSYDDYLH